GILSVKFFKLFHMRDSVKVLILLSIAFLLIALETKLEHILPVSGLIGVVSMSATILKKYGLLAKRLSLKFNKLWVAAEVLLFVLVGATVDLKYVQAAGIQAVLLIFGALVFRMVGVWVSLLKTQLTTKERLFCMIAYTPKATVQAAIGAVPLSMGLNAGHIILTVAVLSILITAPLGAVGIDRTYKKLLENDVK
ncbi:MAG: potassium transporter, partial [Clostridia bacterium]|nr:potassium transporter [Clostridia bacterium]